MATPCGGSLLRSRRLLALLALVTCVAGCRNANRSVPGEYRGAPVILISIDTLRSDRVHAYGYGQIETPAIDRLAKDGILFERAYSQVPLTLPSHVSILTGLTPAEHGVRNNIGYRFDAKTHPTISMALKAAGYDTGAAISAYVLRGGTGLSSAFDFYSDAIAAEDGVAIGQLQRSGETTLASAREWIDGRRDKPFFLLFHIFEPHSSWDAPEPFRSRYAQPYDAEVAAADSVVGKLLDDLDESGLYDRAIIVLLSDHGEGLGDHGEDEHGVFLYREALQVPLIVKLPRSARAGERIARPVQLADVAPTVAALTGVKLKSGSRGIDILDSRALETERRIYSETLYPRLHLGWSELRSLIDVRFHYIESTKPELFDLRADPGERSNVLSKERRTYAAMRDELAKHGREIAAPGSIDPEEASKLAALGYVGSVRSADGELPDPKDRIGDVERMKQAMKLSTDGRLREAESILRALTAENPRFSDAWVLLATVCEQMGRNDDAIAAYRQGLESSPASASQFGLSMAGLLQKMNRLEDARKHAELALAANPSGAHQMLARIAIDSGDFAGAERHLRESMADQATEPKGKVILAQLRAKQGQLSEAVAILEQTRAEAVAQQMRIEHLEFALGDLYATMDRPAEAEAAFRREITAFPGNLDAYSRLAVVLVIQRKFGEVDAVFAEMSARNPTRRAYLVAAESYAALGDEQTSALWRRRAAEAR